jgi:D-alanyl-D-alanine carboxypeptidase
MKIRRALAAALLCAALTLQTARAVETSAASSVLMEAGSGRVLYSKNADDERLIASTTKIMTAIVALENGNTDDVITVKAELANTEGSAMYLSAGEKVSLGTLLYGLLLCSGNDAAMVIADAVGGNVGNFVAMMNAKAAELGMTRTSFANPSGLDDDRQYSSAADMARLAAYAMKNAAFARIVSTREISVGGRTMTNHNKLLTMCGGCVGLKTGYTKAAGRTLVSCAERGGMRLIAVTLRDGNDWDDHIALYDYGFANYAETEAVSAGESVEMLRVAGGVLASVSAQAGDSFYYPLAADEHLTRVISLPNALDAPVAKGDVIGEMRFYLDGSEVGSVPLVCGGSVAKAGPEKTEKKEGGGVLALILRMLRLGKQDW